MYSNPTNYLDQNNNNIQNKLTSVHKKSEIFVNHKLITSALLENWKYQLL